MTSSLIREIAHTVYNYLALNSDTEAEGAAEDGACRGRRPHDTGGKEEAALGVGYLDPFRISRLIQSLDGYEPHLALLAGQGDHQLLLGNVLNLNKKENNDYVMSMSKTF
jgi:hypothetical protein